MNRNQKIALGCGGVGCLGVVLLVGLGALLIVTGVVRAPGIYNPDRNSRYNSNRDTNLNVNLNSNSNTNDDRDSNSDSDSSSSMSDDEQHKLFQAASATQDSAAMLRVMKKFGFLGQSAKYQKFAEEHIAWGLRNLEFIQSINTPEKARAYYDAHIDD